MSTPPSPPPRQSFTQSILNPSTPVSLCTRQPLLWGITVSSLLLIHQFLLVRKGRTTVARAIDVGVFGFLGTSGIHFMVCRSTEKEKRERIKGLMKAAGVKQAGKEA
ncbi:hypothetical protein TrLO_g6007 [Triparma laevis f. longispina]|uniref:Cytochrome c oxidase assembly protein COX20, mitochondrial n=1 Tax=Triparma laevis f. longispina TaxID=1714387 RepID=A0A9W7AKM7_9STRA|nr:hypothetical protein TrLO_g6007 [Triparma laevis f. longispina]